MKFCWIFWLLLSLNCFAQSSGFQLVDKKKVSIPFQQINGLIFLQIEVNGVDLTFLLDSGVAETILFSLENKAVDFKNTEKARFTGLGGESYVEGLKSTNNQMKIGKNLVDHNHLLYLILDEDFNFSSHVGIPVNGIIGYQFFENYPVKIDYQSQEITLYQDEKKLKTRNFEQTPMSIEGSKPYIMTSVEMTNQYIPAKMLVDLGNSDAMWLFPTRIPNFNYNRPNIDDFLGRGFNGDILGKRSRIHALKLGDNVLEKPIVSMPSAESVQSMTFVKDRIGSVGSGILKRFVVIFDYKNGLFYFKKNKSIHDPFKFNMSGLDVKHDGVIWQKDLVKVEIPLAKEKEKIESMGTTVKIHEDFQYKFVLKPIYSISGVREDSPGFLADIKSGDKLISINGKKTTEMSLQDINNIFMSEEEKIIDLVLTRKSLTIERKIQLKDPIPYQEN